MESQPQNPEFRFNPENVHPCTKSISFLTHVRAEGTKWTSYPWLAKMCVRNKVDLVP